MNNSFRTFFHTPLSYTGSLSNLKFFLLNSCVVMFFATYPSHPLLSPTNRQWSASNTPIGTTAAKKPTVAATATQWTRRSSDHRPRSPSLTSNTAMVAMPASSVSTVASSSPKKKRWLRSPTQLETHGQW